MVPIMGILLQIILIILVIVFFLAILGLGWNTFFEGIKKGADKIGITSIIENVTSGAASNGIIFPREFLLASL